MWKYMGQLPCEHIQLGVGYRLIRSLIGYSSDQGNVTSCNSKTARYLVDSDDTRIHPYHAEERPCIGCPHYTGV